MTDVGGIFVIVLCLYACLRALHANTDRAVLGWLAFAALSNALGGTVRQIAWLGVLAIFPATVWLLRRRPFALPAGILLYLVSVAFIFGALRWFQQQPYSIVEPLIPRQLDSRHLTRLVVEFFGLLFGSVLFLLPILSAFVQALSFRNRKTTDRLIVVGVLCLIVEVALCVLYPHDISLLLAPYGGNYVTQLGLVDGTAIQGKRPTVLPPIACMLLTAAVLFAITCFAVFLRSSDRPAKNVQTPAPISWNNLLILLLPFLLGDLALMLPRSLVGNLFDRYLLPLLFVGVILLVRLFQDRVQPRLPLITIALVALFAAYAVAGTHDAFSLFRAKAAAIAEARDAGVPATSIDGGFEHNGMTQIEQFGYMNDARIRVPGMVAVEPSTHFPSNCEPWLAFLTPAIVPGYTLSFDPKACGGLSQFAPAPYHNWLGPNPVNLYIVKTVKAAPKD
jgi:hypothetical protein